MLLANKKFNVEDFNKFFNEVIGFDKFVEVRIFDLSKKYPPFSRYAASINELIKIIKKYNNNRWLLYYGINTRQGMTRTNNEINYRKVFYFDIEHSGDKPPLADEAYSKELSMTISFISDYINEKYGVKPCALVVSGRGVHLYYRHEPLDNVKYKHQFKKWYKDLQDEMDKLKPCKNIKFSDNVFDGSRIAALPGSYNWKYPETPFRNLIFVNQEVFDLKPLLDKIVVKKFNSIDKVYDSKLKFTDGTIRNSPEYQLLSNYDNLPEGKRHCHLVFAFQLLCRDNNITILDELYDELIDVGYDGGELSYPPGEYAYNKNVVNNWCLENYEWCVVNNFKLPFSFSGGVFRQFMKLPGDVDFGDKELKSFDEVIGYIKTFNSFCGRIDNDVIAIYYDCLFNKLKKNCEPVLFKFLVENNLLMSIITLR